MRPLSRWLETFNDGDRDARERFVREHWPSRPIQSVDQELAFREQTGGFGLLTVEDGARRAAMSGAMPG